MYHDYANKLFTKPTRTVHDDDDDEEDDNDDIDDDRLYHHDSAALSTRTEHTYMYVFTKNTLTRRTLSEQHNLFVNLFYSRNLKQK